MKKLLSLLLCMISLFSLFACGDGGAQDDDTASLSGEESSEDAWLAQLMSEAEMVYSWFCGGNSPSRADTGLVEEDGAVYAPVTEPGLSDCDALRDRVSQLFSTDIVDKLMATEVYSGTPVFRDINGQLYYCTNTLGEVPWDIGQRTGSVITRNEAEIIYHLDITHDYYSSVYTAACDYRLVLGEDGQWRFASFRLPALLIADQMFKPDHTEE